MYLARKIIVATLLALSFGATSVASFAAPATSKSSLNVRSGPGTSYRVVDTLYKGERVEVNECVSNGWCFIKHKGPNGWVSAKYLGAITRTPARVKPPRHYPPIKPQQNPPVSFGFSMNSDGGFSFGLGVGDRPNYPNYPTRPATPTNPKTCFYKGVDFTGQRFCVTPGTSYDRLPSSWNDEISSIQVSNGASVKVCRWEDFQGGCWNINNSKNRLGAKFNDRISSFQAY